MERDDLLERNATAARLNRIARLDGYNVKAAKNKAQVDAWRGKFAVLRGDHVMYTGSHPDTVRAWLHTHAA